MLPAERLRFVMSAAKEVSWCGIFGSIIQLRNYIDQAEHAAKDYFKVETQGQLLSRSGIF